MMIVKVVLGVILAYLICSLILNYWLRNHSKKVVRKFESPGNRIALTFDDGPDERYTEQLLDLLKNNQVKATFFVVTEKVKKCPQIIERMKSEGHLIAMHSLKHKNAWFSFPWETYQEFQKTLPVFQKMGLKSIYYRPPWGQFNLFNHHFASKNNMKTVLWTFAAEDWKENISHEDIYNRLRSKFNPNDIVLLHDSGGAKDAPLKTIEALKLFIPYCLSNGVQFITVEEGLENGNN